MAAEADRGSDVDGSPGGGARGQARLVVALVLLAALAVRLWGIRYGLPHLCGIARFAPDPGSVGRIPALSRGVLELPPTILIYRWGLAALPGPAASRWDRALADGRSI